MKTALNDDSLYQKGQVGGGGVSVGESMGNRRGIEGVWGRKGSRGESERVRGVGGGVGVGESMGNGKVMG